MFTLTIQRSVDDFVLLFRPAPNDRNVFFAHLMPLHQEPKIARRRGGLCNQYQSARFAVDAVDSSQALRTGPFPGILQPAVIMPSAAAGRFRSGAQAF